MNHRAAELARSRAAGSLDEAACLIWFGVGQATLERIERGEVEPSAEVAARIDRYLSFCGGSVPSAALPDRRAQGGGRPGEGARGSLANFAGGAFGGRPIHTNRGRP